MKAKLLGLFFVGVSVGILLTGNAVSNGFSALTSKTFYIPAESSFMSFKVTRPNQGSGEWWLYGEDNTNYYALSDQDHYTYLVLRKDAAGPEVDPLDKSTWLALEYTRSQMEQR